MNGSCRGATNGPLVREQHSFSRRFTTNSPGRGMPPIHRASTLQPPPPSLLIDAAGEKGYEKLPPLKENVVAHFWPPTALGWIARSPAPPNPAGQLQPSRGVPTHRLVKQALPSTPWRSYRFSRPNSSAPWTSLAQTLLLLESCAEQRIWNCVLQRQPPR